MRAGGAIAVSTGGLLLGAACATAAFALPTATDGYRPPAGHHVITSARMDAGVPTRRMRIVVIARNREATRDAKAPPRTLIVLEARGGRMVETARNAEVVLRADEGGQCDPFEMEMGGGMTVKGRYVTVENGVACGQHWTDYVTFRLDDRLGLVFDNLRHESWRMTANARTGEQAMVLERPVRIVRGNRAAPVRIADWKRPH